MIIAISVMPASRIDSIQYCDIGLFAIGSNCFGPVCVKGLKRVPCPPCKIIPFIPFNISASIFN
jgi:hypothetical protein